MKDRFDPNSQDPDEPGNRDVNNEGQRIRGRGAMGGGSQRSTALKTFRSGSGHIGSSKPARSQKIRG